MENKEPTPEQIKEFWEWCGFKQGETFTSGMLTGQTHWDYPDGSGDIKLPPIDLNSLFEYAVPKATEKIGRHHTAMLLENWAMAVPYEKEDPALALFWALWAVMKEAK